MTWGTSARGETRWGFSFNRTTLADVLRVDYRATMKAERSVRLLLDLDHGGKAEVLTEFVQEIVWWAEECT